MKLYSHAVSTVGQSVMLLFVGGYKDAKFPGL